MINLFSDINPTWEILAFNTAMPKREEGMAVLYPMILHGRLFYRRLADTEELRYVFCEQGIVIERPDKTATLTTIEKIADDDAYSAPDPAWSLYPDLYRKFIRDVNIPHKPHTAVRIDKDLTVIVGEHRCSYFRNNEQTRAYFDPNGFYYFRKNAVTGRWQQEDVYDWIDDGMDGGIGLLLSHYVDMDEVLRHVIDKDLFDRTCAEEAAERSVDGRFPRGQKINLTDLMAQIGFLCAEQAAKMHSPVYEVILENIYRGRIREGNKPLSELLGISGAQIKFLEDIVIPDDLVRFAECMRSDDFRLYFPDVKKRIFAVSFYLNGNRFRNTDVIARDEVFSAAKTLNSLEKADAEKRKRLLDEYRDYLRMRRVYRAYLENEQPDDPLREEILSFGEMPVNIKPSKISDYHYKMVRIFYLIDSSDQIPQYTKAIQKRYAAEAGDTEYTNGVYSIRMPKDASEIICEGMELQHCVGSAGYIGAMAQKRTTILFLRDNSAPDIPLITLEVRDGELRQCYGFRDRYNDVAAIRDFIEEYAAIHQLKITCVIYSA